jgi:putative ABC transport system permease protein
MGVLIRGAKNAFRNIIRTFSVTLILAISIGLALIMLLSYRTVEARLESVKGTIGNTVTVTPSGSQGFEGGGEPLTSSQLAQVSGLANVVGIKQVLTDRLTPTTDTNLVSAIDPGTLGTRRARRNTGSTSPNQPARPTTIPISVTGLSDVAMVTDGTVSIISGSSFGNNADEASAVIGKELATKNNLSVGSTFTAYSTTITVKAIYDASGNKFANSGMYMPLKTLQRLSSQPDQISTAVIQVDSITNVDSVATAVKNKLGSDKVDVVSNVDAAKQALSPLESIKTTSLYSLVGALVAGAIITLLTMIMIVRERRREIGVLKAIGASNAGVVGQFVTESLVLTLMGAVVGVIGGVLFSNQVLTALVAGSNTAANVATPGGGGGGRGFGRVAQLGGQLGGGVQSAVRGLHATVGWDVLLYGLLAAIAIAVIGSALPAWLIAKVKPAEVMRGE